MADSRGLLSCPGHGCGPAPPPFRSECLHPTCSAASWARAQLTAMGPVQPAAAAEKERAPTQLWGHRGLIRQDTHWGQADYGKQGWTGPSEDPLAGLGQEVGVCLRARSGASGWPLALGRPAGGSGETRAPE